MRDIKYSNGGARSGAGRKPGYKTPNTIKKSALKVLQSIMEDSGASSEARAIATCKLIDEARQ